MYVYSFIHALEIIIIIKRDVKFYKISVLDLYNQIVHDYHDFGSQTEFAEIAFASRPPDTRVKHSVQFIVFLVVPLEISLGICQLFNRLLMTTPTYKYTYYQHNIIIHIHLRRFAQQNRLLPLAYIGYSHFVQ